MSATMHFLIWHCCCRPFVSRQSASTTTRYPPLSNYAIGNQHASTVVSVRRYRPPRALRLRVTQASRHWSRCCRRSVRRCKNHLYEGSVVVPDLRLDRNILRRRMKGRRSGLRAPRPRDGYRVTSCSRGWRRKRGRLNRRVSFSERIAWKTRLNRKETLSNQTQQYSWISSAISNMTIVLQISAASVIDEEYSTRSSCPPPI